MATPFWCWLVVVIRLYAPITIGRILASSLLALGCCLAWPNTELGLQRGRDGVKLAESLTRDIERGVPPFQIIRRYGGDLHPDSHRLGQLLPLFRAGKIGPFVKLVDNPPFQEIKIAVEPVQVRQARMEGITARVLGVDPQITFALPRPRYVAGIRLRYSHTNPQGGPARFIATWKGPEDRTASAARRYANWQLPTGSQLETTVWVDATIDEFQIQPDNQPGLFRFDAITLLIPLKP